MITTALIVTLFVLPWVHATAFENLLKTDQYLLIGVSGCGLSIEAHIPDRSCPHHYYDEIWATGVHCSWNNVLTLTDPSEKSSVVPKLLAVGEIDGRSVALVKPLELPTLTTGKRLVQTASLTENATELPELSRLRPLNVLYDSEARMLYAFTTDIRSTYKLHAFTVDFFGDAVKLQFLFDAVISKEFARSHWFSDPYSKKMYFYGKPRNNEPIEIQAFSSGQLLRSLSVESAPGPVEVTVKGDHHAISIADQLVISSQYSTPNINYFTAFHDNSTDGIITCQFTQRRVAEIVLILRDWDYCRVRDGSKANFATCRSEYAEWARGQSEAATGLSLRLMAAAVVVVSVILLIVLTLMYRRSRKVTSFEIENPDDDCVKVVTIANATM